jgi:hypothetical protein
MLNTLLSIKNEIENLKHPFHVVSTFIAFAFGEKAEEKMLHGSFK